VLAEAVRILAEYVREGFRLFNERFEGIDKRLSSLEDEVKRLKTTSDTLRALWTRLNQP
jgi:archaellum component FlaC